MGATLLWWEERKEKKKPYFHIIHLKKSRWKGKKSRNIRQGHRLIYTGSPSGKNGVAVVRSRGLQDELLEIDRLCDCS